MEMLEVGYGGIKYPTILRLVADSPDVMQSLVGKLEHITAEEIATDIRLCSFLTRDRNDEFCFVHRSFMEFFLARSIRYSLDEEGDLSVLKKRLSPAVIYFLGSFLVFDERLKKVLIDAYKSAHSADPVYRRNILATILQSGNELKSIFIEGVVLDGSVVPSGHWTWVRLKHIEFISTTWKRPNASKLRIPCTP